MYELEVTGMSCQGCVSSVRRLIRSKDPGARVEGDPDSGVLKVVTSLSTQEVSHLVEEAGFIVNRLSSDA